MSKDISVHNTRVSKGQQVVPGGKSFAAEGNRTKPAGEKGGLDSQPKKLDPKKGYGA